mmetsp:Transcript_17830/g.38495  ORF Transcript_17830/g.38495 Transcript_17830/m.38495 type:complete len:208 (-) Transcript_17830:1025-1648(-)
MNSQVGIRRNDSTSREIHTLPHQVTTNTSLLGLEPLCQRFERTSTPLSDLRHSPHFIVDECSHVVLKCLLKLLNDNVGFPVLDSSFESNVGLDNVDKLMGEIILRRLSTPSHDDRGTDVKRRHGHHRDAHPLRTSPSNVESKSFNLVIPHLFEDINGLLSTHELLLIPTTPWNSFHLISILNFHVQSHLGILWLIPIAVIALLFGAN